MEVKAALCSKGGDPLSVETLSLDGFGDNDILIENKAAGLCASDLGQLGGKKEGIVFPLLSGHEGAGVVLEVGKNVTHVKPGDHVATCALGECGECDHCQAEKTNMCQTAGLKGLAAAYRHSDHFKFNGEPVAVTAPGATFSTHSICDGAHVTAIPKDIPFDVGCLLSCAVLTGVGSALQTAKVQQGSTVAVIGLGGVGLNVIDAARYAGAERIIGVDINPDKEAIGKQFGMTDFILSTEIDSIAEQIKELTSGGVDYAFECSGISALIHQAIAASKPEWGTVTLVGIPSNPELPLSTRDILSGRRITGSYFGNMKGRTGVHWLAEQLSEGKFNCDKLVSERLTLENINSGFDAIKNGKTIRSVVVY